jgi:acyl-CoA synthetase (AMP-forming)/AMP-acid ligase II
MSVLDRTSEIWDTVRATVRFALDTPKILPSARCSPATRVRHWAGRRPGNLALAFQDERFTWEDVNERVNQYAAWFSEEGIEPGDTVALIMDNRPDYLFIVTALSRIGGIASLINTNLSGEPLVHGISICNAKRIVTGSEHLERITEVLDEITGISPERDLYVQVENGAAAHGGFRTINAEVSAAPTRDTRDGFVPQGRDVYCYIYTSGTTGFPKAAVIRNQRMLGANFSFGRLMHRSGPGDVIYVALPLYHSSAMFLGWGAALATGAGVALRRKFSVSSFWKDVREFRATSFLYIGELCRYLLNAPPQEGERDHFLRVAVGNGMGPNIWEPFQERFGIPTIREFYGATEGNAPILNYQGRPRMVGRLGPGQALVACDPATGEVVRNDRGFCEQVSQGEAGLLLSRISGLLTFDGYVDQRATEQKIERDVFKQGDRYFNSGDLLQLHEGHWMSFADRVGDTFRWKGENVSTAEVSSILGDAAGILEANVYGVRVPHAEGRAGMAALDVSEDFDVDAFADFVCMKLPGYQRPRFLRLIRSGMRVTGTFKHQKVDYREEGFDPRKIADPLYILDGDRYVPIDGEFYARIESGEFGVA